jgi:hypothetical protein
MHFARWLQKTILQKEVFESRDYTDTSLSPQGFHDLGWRVSHAPSERCFVRVRFRRLILERHPLRCGGFASTRIIHSFGAGKHRQNSVIPLDI